MLKVLNCTRLLTRLMPYIYEEAEWRGYFWSESPVFRKERNFSEQPLAEVLLNSLIVRIIYAKNSQYNQNLNSSLS